MNSSSWSSSFRQKLRVKFYNWLTQIYNTTSTTSSQHIIDKPQTHSPIGYARSSDAQHITNGQSRLFLDALPTINDIYVPLNDINYNSNSIENDTNISGNIDSYLTNNTFTNSLFGSNWWNNNSNAIDVIKSFGTVEMMHQTNSYDTLQSHTPNLTQLIDLKNLSKQLNLTEDHLKDFVTKSFQLGKIINESGGDDDTIDSSACHYCNGFVKDLFGGYKNMHGYISLAICIFGTIANILNIIVLTRKDMSKSPINTILKWLAVTDMFVMIEYIPFAIYMYILPIRTYSWAVYVLFHMHFTQILHTISISLTVILALWRYIAIKHPHGRLATCVLAHCGFAIVLAFITSPILCLPTYFVFRISEIWTDNHTLVYKVNPRKDSTWYSLNFWIHSVIIKLLPCLVLTVISFVLIHVLYQAAKRRVKLKAYNEEATASNVDTVLNGHRPSKCQRRTDRTTMLLVAVLILFLITEFPQGILGLLSGILEKCFFAQCYNLMGEMMDLLALINAAIGFVLYGLMSKQFRTSFKSVFFEPRLSRIEMTRITNLNNTTCV